MVLLIICDIINTEIENVGKKRKEKKKKEKKKEIRVRTMLRSDLYSNNKTIETK